MVWRLKKIKLPKLHQINYLQVYKLQPQLHRNYPHNYTQAKQQHLNYTSKYKHQKNYTSKYKHQKNYVQNKWQLFAKTYYNMICAAITVGNRSQVPLTCGTCMPDIPWPKSFAENTGSNDVMPTQEQSPWCPKTLDPDASHHMDLPRQRCNAPLARTPSRHIFVSFFTTSTISRCGERAQAKAQAEDCWQQVANTCCITTHEMDT